MVRNEFGAASRTSDLMTRTYGAVEMLAFGAIDEWRSAFLEMSSPALLIAKCGFAVVGADNAVCKVPLECMFAVYQVASVTGPPIIFAHMVVEIRPLLCSLVAKPFVASPAFLHGAGILAGVIKEFPDLVVQQQVVMLFGLVVFNVDGLSGEIPRNSVWQSKGRSDE
jgi:hypothetical protein